MADCGLLAGVVTFALFRFWGFWIWLGLAFLDFGWLRALGLGLAGFPGFERFVRGWYNIHFFGFLGGIRLGLPVCGFVWVLMGFWLGLVFLVWICLWVCLFMV